MLSSCLRFPVRAAASSVSLLTPLASRTSTQRRSAMSSAQSFHFAVKGQEGDIPMLGLGTANLKGDPCVASVQHALASGYKMVDTALLYGNQVEVGRGIRESGVARDAVWVTSKIAFFPPDGSTGDTWMFNANNVKGDEARSVDLCLEQLQLDAVDLLLIHNPCGTRIDYGAASLPHFFELKAEKGEGITPTHLPDGTHLRELILGAKRDEVRRANVQEAARKARRAAWKGMEEALKAGKCRYIGVSNYPLELLQEMAEYATVMPCVNQLELHPRFSSPRLREFCSSAGIVLTGYGSGISMQVKGQTAGRVQATIAGIATELGRSPWDVVLRWTIQSGVVAIPRSASEEHIRENMACLAFELSEEHMNTINGLNGDYPYYWDLEAALLAL